MAIQIEMTKRGGTSGASGAEQTRTITYRVIDTEGSLTTESIALGASDGTITLPSFNDQHPDVPNLRASEFSINNIDGQPYGWDIVWTYKQVSLVPGDPGRDPDDLGPGTFPSAKSNMSFRLLWVDSWRAQGYGLAPNGVASNTALVSASALAGSVSGNPLAARSATTNDINGMTIDSQGEPASSALIQVQLDITQFTTKRAVFNTLRQIVGKRNSQVEFGAAIGTLLYLGPDMSELPEGGFQYVHHFVWDENFHARQQVWRLTDGKPSLGSSQGLTGTDQPYRDFGYPVHWIQPYPQVASFAPLEINFG